MRTDMVMQGEGPRSRQQARNAPGDAAAQPKRVCVGVIVGAHGVRGAVRVKSFTEEARGLTSYGVLTDEAGARRFALQPVGAARGAVLARVDGIADRDAAEALRGTRLYAERGAFPATRENEFYLADLIGLAVETKDGAKLGRVRTIENFGAGDLIDLELAAGGSAYLPFTKAVAPLVDLAGGRIVVDPPEGLLPEGLSRKAPKAKARNTPRGPR